MLDVPLVLDDLMELFFPWVNIFFPLYVAVSERCSRARINIVEPFNVAILLLLNHYPASNIVALPHFDERSRRHFLYLNFTPIKCKTRLQRTYLQREDERKKI